MAVPNGVEASSVGHIGGSSFLTGNHYVATSPIIRRVLYHMTQFRTAADALPFLLSAIVTSGKTSVLAFLGVYVAFILLWLPFWLLSFLVSEWGVYTLAVFCIFFIGRSIIRLIAFPGASSKLTSEIEIEFAKYSVRMLVSACGCLLDLANAVISTSKSSSDSLSMDGNRAASSTSFAYYEIPGLWKRAKSYRDRALGVYLHVLHYIFDSQSDLHLSINPSSPPQQQDSRRTKYGMNKFSGDIGDLAGLTPQAKEDGWELTRQLTKVLSHLDRLEQEASTALNASASGGKPIAYSEAARAAARELLCSASELRDFVLSLKPPSSEDKDREDYEEYDANGDAIPTRSDGNGQNNESVYGAVQSGLSSLLPMIDPPLHKSIFGFDVQRGCFLSRYMDAKQVWVRRPKGGMIDVIHIPAKVRGAEASSSDAPAARNPKAVLYCNPNAGLIEVAAGMSLAGGNVGPDSEDNARDSSWIDFYTDLGYDIYLFNYAGFGRSYGATLCISGTSPDKNYVPGIFGRVQRIFRACFLAFKPTPDTLREDGLTVANFMIGEAGVQSLVIHGESIGGVAASATARQLSHIGSMRDKVSLLICDRTFCNLEAVAQRLVGSWTGYAIKALAPFWVTDVAGDFVAAQCAKVVANDYADAIIIDPSSLKSGVSIWREIQRGGATTRGIGWLMETPLHYRMADFDNVCVNESQHFASSILRTQAPVWPSDKHISLEEAFRFAACAKRIGRMAKQSVQVPLLVDEEEDGQAFNLADLSGSSASVVFEAWKTLATCDGLCGAPLGLAVKHGFDATVSWLCGCLTYGGQIVVDRAERRLAKEENGTFTASSSSSDRGSGVGILPIPSDFDGRAEGFEKQESSEIHPKPIPEVLEKLKGLLEQGGEESLSGVTYELNFVISMLEYIIARLTSAAVVESSWKCKHLKRDETMVGSFLNLHCGHNNPYSKSERKRLKEILVEAASFGNTIS